MFQFCKEQYLKYKEVINYLIFGVLTTVVNFVIYIISTNILKIDKVVANVVAWIVSVIFAYITNRIYVFKSDAKEIKQIIREIYSFVGCRLFSGIVDIVSFYGLVTVLKVNDIISKVIISVLVVILNYIFSKLIIFKKKKEKEV